MQTKTTIQTKTNISRFAEYHFDTSNIGEWDGEEPLAASQLNHMLATLNKVLPKHTEKEEIHTLYLKIWNDWGTDTRILSATRIEISIYAINSLKNYLAHNSINNAA